MGASLILHGFVLVGMGVGTLPGSASGPGELVVYLAMPSFEAQQVPTKGVSLGKTAVAKPANHQPKKKVRPEPVKIEPAPVTRELETVSVLEPQIDDVRKQLIQTVELPAEEISKIDTVIPATIHKPPTTHPDSRFETADVFSDPSSGVEEVFLATSHQPLATGLLAFAGDPAALGMLARDTLGPDLVKAEVLSLPEPVYPVLSRKRGEEGKVLIEIGISAKGKVLKAQVTSSSSHPRLDRAALEAVKVATFSPATEYGRPVESVRKIAYRFRLEGK